MTQLDNLTAAFECLWEARLYLLRAQAPAPAPKLAALTREVSLTRDHVEAALIELQAQPPHAPAPPRA